MISGAVNASSKTESEVGAAIQNTNYVQKHTNIGGNFAGIDAIKNLLYKRNA